MSYIEAIGKIIIWSIAETFKKGFHHNLRRVQSLLQFSLWKRQAETLLTKNGINCYHIAVICKPSQGDFNGVFVYLKKSTCPGPDLSSVH